MQKESYYNNKFSKRCPSRTGGFIRILDILCTLKKVPYFSMNVVVVVYIANAVSNLSETTRRDLTLSISFSGMFFTSSRALAGTVFQINRRTFSLGILIPSLQTSMREQPPRFVLRLSLTWYYANSLLFLFLPYIQIQIILWHSYFRSPSVVLYNWLVYLYA